MNLQIGTTSEFRKTLKDLEPGDPYDIDDAGQAVAFVELGEAFVFVDRLAESMRRRDEWKHCLHCANRHGPRCDFDSLDAAVLMDEISRTCIHELEHLCGVSEKQIREFPVDCCCPFYKDPPRFGGVV